MWLVISSSSDPSGIWAWEGLRQMGLAPLEFVTAESLAFACRWEHRLGSRGTSLTLSLADGRVLSSSSIQGGLNRLCAPSPLAFERAAVADRDYAQAEMFAFYLSWLHSLTGKIINRPAPSGLSGPWLHASEWMMLAARAGLRTPLYRQSSCDGPALQPGVHLPADPRMMNNVIAFDGQIFGGLLPDSIAQACFRLLEHSKMEILGISLCTDDHGRWTFAGATPTPDLRGGGIPLLRHLAHTLVSGGPS
jgi:hypothetical protein